MHCVNTPTVAFLVLVIAGSVHSFDESVYSSLALVLRGNDSVNGAIDDTRFYFDYWCYIDFPPDGNLRSGDSEGLWSTEFQPNPKSQCHDSPVRYTLQTDGNFIIHCSLDNSFDYISRSNQGHVGNFFMAIDDSCQLRIFKGTLECNECDVDVDLHEEIWSSDKYGPWEIGDKLRKGQIYHGPSGYEVVLNPYNGNLEVRDPRSHGTYDIVWQASDEWDGLPGDHLHDYYAKLTSEGFLILVGIDYQNGMKQEEYFSKRLDTGGADCFTLGFELTGEEPYAFCVSDPIDLIAVPCE